MSKIRISLDEQAFRNANSNGSIGHKVNAFKSVEVTFTKSDIFNLAEGDIVSKTIDGRDFEIALQDIGFDRIDQILSNN